MGIKTQRRFSKLRPVAVAFQKLWHSSKRMKGHKGQVLCCPSWRWLKEIIVKATVNNMLAVLARGAVLPYMHVAVWYADCNPNDPVVPPM